MGFSPFSGRDNYLIFDIGNAPVGGALGRQGKKSPLKILAGNRSEIPFAENVRFDRLLKHMLETTSTVANSLRGKSSIKKALVYVVLAAPWYACETKMLKLRRNKPFIYTEELQDSIIKKEADLYAGELSKRNKNTDKNLVVIEKEVIHVNLNGYETSSPFGKLVSQVDMALYLSVSHDKIIKSIAEKLYPYARSGKIQFCSFPLAYYSTVRDLYPKKNDYLLLDISGEVTDISLIRRGILVETASFPFGKNSILRRIGSDLRLTMQETQSNLSLFKKKSLSVSAMERMEKSISRVKREWLENFSKLLVNISSGLYVPTDIFLTSDPDMTELFTTWVTREEFSQYVFTHDKFKVITLGQAPFTELEISEGVNRDDFLNIDSLFVRTRSIY